jgi:hypothetical protein
MASQSPGYRAHRKWTQSSRSEHGMKKIYGAHDRKVRRSLFLYKKKEEPVPLEAALRKSFDTRGHVSTYWVSTLYAKRHHHSNVGCGIRDYWIPAVPIGTQS